MGWSGMNDAINQLEQLGEVRDPCEKAMTKWLIIIGTEAAALTPIDTSTLINSQYRDLFNQLDGVSGRIGYFTDYAYFVHSPKFPMKFKRASAEKNFLKKGIVRTSDKRKQILKKEIRDWLR
jgi:hypothetical protein